MNYDRPNRDPDFPELLAGYADGELSVADADRVESWLAQNPDGRAELESQRQVSAAYGSPWPSEWIPTEAHWSRVVREISQAISAPRPIVAPAARVSRNRLLMAFAAIAAAAMLAVFLFPRDDGDATTPSPIESFAVATDDDVEIMRVLEIDVDRLVVGESPVRRPLVLATFEDVDGVQVVRDTDGMMPMVAMQAAVAPMIVAPMASK
jgi:anti-sigma factor RsiW